MLILPGLVSAGVPSGDEAPDLCCRLPVSESAALVLVQSLLSGGDGRSSWLAAALTEEPTLALWVACRSAT